MSGSPEYCASGAGAGGAGGPRSLLALSGDSATGSATGSATDKMLVQFQGVRQQAHLAAVGVSSVVGVGGQGGGGPRRIKLSANLKTAPWVAGPTSPTSGPTKLTSAAGSSGRGGLSAGVAVRLLPTASPTAAAAAAAASCRTGGGGGEGGEGGGGVTACGTLWAPSAAAAGAARRSEGERGRGGERERGRERGGERGRGKGREKGVGK
jgi:hypothetical protein